jgi:hypothetical protein
MTSQAQAGHTKGRPAPLSLDAVTVSPVLLRIAHNMVGMKKAASPLA